MACILVLFLTNDIASSQTATFTAPPFDQVLDLHGDPVNADLVVFMAGNQFMVGDALMNAFRKSNPRVRRIFFETLPPGILAQQMKSGSLRMGNLVITARPDVFLSGRRRMLEMRKIALVSTPFAYATNHLAIMVGRNNPKRVNTLADLGRPDVRVSMPNPRTEGVAIEIERAYRRAGGDALVRAIMIAKVANRTTILTTIHHRETPASILNGRADAGPVWSTEALYQERRGAPIKTVIIPQRDNVTAIYEAAMVLKSDHIEAAKSFLKFLRSQSARTIFRSYGFGRIDQR